MKLMFVRHAEPDYRHDSLTAKGRVEAELLSQRLTKLDVKAFYTSPLGRAKETARYTLEKLGRTAEELPWLAEYRGRCPDPEDGHMRIPWDLKPAIWQSRPMLMDARRWAEDPLFDQGTVRAVWAETQQGLDALLARHGYVHQGGVFLCERNKPDTLILFCHFGITAACMGHLLGISPILLWHGFCTQPSSVTTLVTEERQKGVVVFRCMQMGDLSHLYPAGERHSTAGLFPECYTGVDSTNPPEWTALGY